MIVTRRVEHLSPDAGDDRQTRSWRKKLSEAFRAGVEGKPLKHPENTIKHIQK